MIKKIIGGLAGIAIIAAVIGGIVFVSSVGQKEGAIVAKVNGEEIRQGDIDRHVAQIENNPQAFVPEKSNVAARKEFEKLVLEDIINETLLYQEAIARGFAPKEEEVDKQYDEIVAQFGGAAAFASQIKTLGIQEKEVRLNIRKFLALNALQENLLVGVDAVTEEEILDLYNEEVVKKDIDISIDEVREQIQFELERRKISEIIENELRAIKERSTVEILI